MKITMNFENICRTCSLAGDLRSLFNKDTLLIADMLTEIVDLKVMKGDSFPQNICIYCLEKLKTAYLFKKQCQDVNNKFEKYLQTNGSNRCKEELFVSSVKVESLFSDSNDDDWNGDDVNNFPTSSLEPEVLLKTSNENSQPALPDSLKTKSQKRKIRKNIEKNHKFECTICHKSVANLRGHLRTHTNNEKTKKRKEIKPSENGEFKCEKCNKKFESDEQLQAHKITHDEKSYLCNHCGKELSSLIGLNAHIRTHTGEKPYKCKICNKSFSRDSVFIVHQKTHSGERPYRCTFCDKSFSQIATLNRHRLIHTGDKPYKCDICNQTFRQIPHLKYHSLTHSGEKPCKCTVCEKKFSNSSVLTKHMRIHTGEKPYKCTFCEKTFRHLTSLYKHKSVHTDERPFTCIICNKSFKQKNHLKYHSQTHTGEKPYKCTICSKQFSLNGTLTVHMRIHTGGGNTTIETVRSLDSTQPV